MRYFYIVIFLALPSYSANNIITKSFNQLAKTTICTVGGTLTGAFAGSGIGAVGYIASTRMGLAKAIGDENPYGYEPVGWPPGFIYSTAAGAMIGGLGGLMCSFAPGREKAKSDVEKSDVEKSDILYNPNKSTSKEQLLPNSFHFAS